MEKASSNFSNAVVTGASDAILLGGADSDRLDLAALGFGKTHPLPTTTRTTITIGGISGMTAQSKRKES